MDIYILKLVLLFAISLVGALLLVKGLVSAIRYFENKSAWDDMIITSDKVDTEDYF